jgi:hypothetical protein
MSVISRRQAWNPRSSPADRQIRVRGFVEERGGPCVEATRPEQIEFVERE